MVSEAGSEAGREGGTGGSSAGGSGSDRRGAELELELVRIRASRGWARLNLGEVWRARELIWFLAWRDVAIRYKQTLLGASWAILQPFLTMVVFSLFFGRLAGIPSDGVPYPIFSFAALVPWTFFEFGVTQGSMSLVASSNLIKKVYFPRLAAPTAAVLSGLPDFLMAFGVLLGMMAWYGIAPSLWGLLTLPLFLALGFATSLGVSLWLSAWNARYRDVRYVVPFLTRLWMFGTPVAYPSTLLEEPWRTLYALNPMVGVIEGFRWALLGTDTAPGPMVAASALAALALLVGGAFAFRRMERTLADVV